MIHALDAGPGDALAGAFLRRRSAAGEAFFAAEEERLARLCHRVAGRFARGGRLIAFGATAADRSDARHVAVEFVHPVIVGKRALPALGLTRDAGPLPLQVELAARPDDVVLAFGGDGGDEGAREVRAALAAARARGCLTVAFTAAGAEWEFVPPDADPFVRQELVETFYHVLWELVHVFFEHPGLLPETPRAGRDVGASAFLYPFLGAREANPEAVVEDVRRSIRMKAAEVSELRGRTVREGLPALLGAADALRAAFVAGGTLLALGNGGSATDAMDAVADFRAAPQGWPGRPALDLTEDAAILTAISNDVGTDAVFARQIIAYGREGDVVLAFSTSGSSRNVVQALAEARGRGLGTIALVGYDGGRILAEGLADHVVVAPSQHVPRIQEAQATAYHLLRELVENAAAGAADPLRR